MATSIRLHTAVAIITGFAVMIATVSTGNAGPESSGSSKKATKSKKRKKPAKRSCKPWVCDVSEKRQQQALAFYEEGNVLLEETLFLVAVAKYRAAIELWDHPAIHYNLALAHNGREQPIEAYKSLQKALRYNGDALQADELRQAREMLARLRATIAQLHVVCDVPGATVTLDGKPLFTGPGQATRLVSVGQHHIEARKHEHVPAIRAVDLPAERQTTVALRPIPEAEARRKVRRWPLWLPLAIAGAGAGVGALGLVFDSRSDSNYAEYERLLSIECSATTGCPDGPRPDVDDLYSRARWQQGVAYGAYGLAAVAVLGGLTMSFFNGERIEESEEMGNLVRISVSPVVSHDGVGVAAKLSF